jgi:hypothetical protein
MVPSGRADFPPGPVEAGAGVLFCGKEKIAGRRDRLKQRRSRAYKELRAQIEQLGEHLQHTVESPVTPSP